MLNIRRLLIVCAVGLLLVLGLAWLSFYLITRHRGRDWPMWRYDANRSASSPQKLPDELHLQWMREYPKLTQAWENPLNQDLMQFDKVYEPVVQGKTLFIGSSASDRMVALDTETGDEKWAFYVDGPVRLPPVAFNGKVYFVSDDGYLYCVDAVQGKLIWKFRGGPSDRKILGNERIISTWPARGGPVLKDGIIYFGAGIWPFMGVFIYALDAETGEVVWANDGTGSIYMLQPHNSPSYAGVAPQGTFVVAGDRLLVPCGRSVPACFDRRTGELLYYHLSSYNKTGGAFVCALGDFFINYHRDFVTSIYDLSEGNAVIRRFGNIPVMTEKALFSMGESVIAYDFKHMKQLEEQRIVIDKDDQKAEAVKDRKWVLDQLWKCNVDASGDLIKAGKRLYAGGENVVSAIKIPWLRRKPKVTWKTRIEGTAARLIAADKKLFVVTLEGSIYAFSGKDISSPKVYPYTVAETSLSEETAGKAESILETTRIRDGYCLAYGLETGELVEALAQNSDLRIIAVDPDPAKVDRLRRRFEAAGFDGKRLSVHVGDPFSFEAPPYLASLTVFGDRSMGLWADRLMGSEGEKFFKRIYHSIRPYGGVACLPVSEDEIPVITQQIQESELLNASVRVEHDAGLEGRLLLLSREGPLPGAADWTHQYGDIANTVKSDDQLVKLPLGILWFGGSSNMDVLPRHGHGPPEQVIGGRLFIEGIDCFSARDVYTGRVLWKRTISDLDTFGTYYDETYKDTPLDPAYNQIHIPGANARSANFAAALDKVYIAKKDSCLVLDTATGKTIDEIELPPDPKTGQVPEWGYIGVYKDYLIAGAGFVYYLDFLEFDELTSETASRRRPFYDFDITSSKKLVVTDRHTGKVLWTRDSELGFRHSAIAVGNDKIFCIDMIPPLVSDALKRRLGEYRFGEPRIVALNVRNGRTVWSTNKDVSGTWLSYSEEHDILVQAGRSSRDMLRGEPDEGMSAYRGRNGNVLWSIGESYGGPVMLHGDTIITDRYAYSLLTGEQKMRADPLTGEEKPWMFRRNYGCNYATASEHLLTFRSAAAGFYDLTRDGGTGNFGGFKSGCTSNLVVANGVLNAPDYTRTCSCSYQNQSSLALVYMPDVEMWTDYFSERKTRTKASSATAAALFDPRGYVAHINSPFLKMWGYDKNEEVLGKPGPELLGPNEKILELIQALSDEGRWAGEAVAVKKDGSKLDVHVSANVVTDQAGEPIYVVASFIDVAQSEEAGQKIEHPDFADLTMDQLIIGGKPIRSVGINLGAPGDRRADNGTLWLEYPRVGGPSPEVPVSINDEKLLFSIDPEFQIDLDNESISEELQQEFGNKGISLSQHAAVSTEKKDSEWLITKIANKKTYIVRKEEGRLNIYHKDYERYCHHSSRIQGAASASSKPVPAWVAASGIKGVSFITITLAGKPDEAADQNNEEKLTEEYIQERTYTVQLYFSEPEEKKPGQRVFDIAIQGRKVLESFDIVKEAGGPNLPVVKEFGGILVKEDLTVAFTPSSTATVNAPLICGIEVMAEEW